jgi:uncharacterized protein YggU (UPF0235/DUF167 family)
LFSGVSNTPVAAADVFGAFNVRFAWTVRATDGANAAVIELIAKPLGVARGAVEVVAGASSRRKTIKVRGVSRAAVEELAT